METKETPAPDDDDLYSGYNEFHPALDPKTLQNDEGFQQAALKSSYGKRGIYTGMRPTGPSRMGTAGFRRGSIITPGSGRRTSNAGALMPPTTARPMTAVRGAGYSSINNRSPNNAAFDPLNQAKSMSTFQGKDETSPEAKIKLLEKKVNMLLEESVLNSYREEFELALEKAKEAAAKERILARQKEQITATEGISANIDLAFTVMFNLAIQYTKNEMFTEAINTYTTMIKNRSFQNTGRLRLNIGNIYFQQANYPRAIKFFRMALDQVPNMQKDMRMKIMRNIGLAFVRINQFTDAITSFEYIMSEKGDFRTALHLIVCHYALGDREKMRKCFQKLLETPNESGESDTKGAPVPEDEEDPMHALINEAIRTDEQRKIERERRHEQDWCILTSAKLIAPVVGDSFSQGYEWCVEQIRGAGYTELASDLEINKAVKHLKKREFNEAIETLKTFEKKDSKSASTAATNLSFLYLLQNEITQAEKYADEAITADHYNAGALVNKGNCCFKHEDFERAREYYKEALSNETTCAEALYNLALTSKKLGLLDAALDCAYRLNGMVKNHAYVLYQIGNIYEELRDKDQCLDWYQQLLNFVPSDPSLLNKLSDIALESQDKHQAFSYLTESYRFFPSHIPTIERLAIHYIDSKVYEKATRYLERASLVQPNEIKWLLMIAACYRRTGNYQLALQYYKKIHQKFPENTESLRLMVRICNDLELPEGRDYLEKLKRLEKAKELNNQRRENARSASRSSRRSAASSNSREGSASSNSSGYATEGHPRSSSKLSSKRNAIFNASETNGNSRNGSDSFIEDLGPAQERPTTSWRRKQADEDDFAGDEIGDILPE